VELVEPYPLVDYLQFNDGSANGRQAENRHHEISEISRSLQP